MSKVAPKTQVKLVSPGLTSTSGFRASALQICDGAELVIGQCRDFSFPKHTHQEYTIGLVISGTEEFYCEGSTHPANMGSIYFSHPGQVHAGISINQSQWAFASLYLAPDYYSDHFEGWMPRFDTALVNDAVSTQFYHDLITVLQASACDVERQSALLTFAGQMTRRHAHRKAPDSGSKAHKPALRRAMDFMHTFYNEPITLKEIARKADLHPGYFVSSFKKELGITPHAYLRSVRLVAARQALKDGSSPTNAALDCGFYDQSHLGRHFIKTFGFSPVRFQKCLKGQSRINVD
jgi:AraC-like DNA-binding protein